MHNLPPGTMALVLFGISFFSLQIYWISKTLKPTKENMVEAKNNGLEETRRKLEQLIKK
ncbi:hypothetical protein [Prochlorococcus marinus]|uniref:hypothetical protein n=1 Tax=Prochlorococcus marinus TaxID=1219 RepID=UPI0022B48654|nr:hypothetical protein [Prochlorococcus marinus]